jgi:S-DNA-T family DNA segregation ATPase FtsK/SpoIIIE
MRRDERVLEERYNAQEPAAVSREVIAAADSMARMLEELDEGGWNRTGIYNWPTTEVRTVDWIGRHSVHEEIHHLQDIALLLQASPRPTDR